MPSGKDHNRIEGIVLRAFASRDADIILRVLSPTEGKLSVIAKHGKKGGKRFGGTPDLFDCGRFEVKQGRGGLPAMQGFAPSVNFTRLRDNLDKISAAALLCEVVDNLSLEGGHGEEDQYHALLSGLDAVQVSASQAETLAATFECAATLMEQAGFLDREQLGDRSVKRLQSLLIHIENCVEKKLASRPAFEQFIETFRRKSSGDQ